MKYLKTQIERWISERNASKARRGIQEYLKDKSSDHDDRLLEACDWYRRLGHHIEALRILKLSEGIRGWGSENFRRRRIYWMARSFNLLGASEFAQSLTSLLKPVSADEYRLLGGIALTRLEYQEAAVFYKLMTELDTAPESYASRLAAMSYADALYGLGEHDEALRRIRQVFQRSVEPMAQSIALSAEGEYLARMGAYRKALPTLQKALSLLPASDRSSDMGFLRKWLGFTQLYCGNVNEGLSHLEEARKILYEASHRPEAWLDVLLLKAQSGFATPEEIAILFRYPGMSPEFQRKIIAASITPLPPSEIPSKKNAAVLDFSCEEFVVKGYPKWGLSLEQKLLGWVILAQPWGLSTVIAKCMLWPDEVFSFLQLEGRLEVALHRVRQRFKVSIRIEDDRIFVSTIKAGKVKVIPKPIGHLAVPSFLRSNVCFERSDAEKFYDTTKSSASRWIGDWINRGWIKRETTPRGRIRYRTSRLK